MELPRYLLSKTLIPFNAIYASSFLIRYFHFIALLIILSTHIQACCVCTPQYCVCATQLPLQADNYMSLPRRPRLPTYCPDEYLSTSIKALKHIKWSPWGQQKPCKVTIIKHLTAPLTGWMGPAIKRHHESLMSQ